MDKIDSATPASPSRPYAAASARPRPPSSTPNSTTRSPTPGSATPADAGRPSDGDPVHSTAQRSNAPNIPQLEAGSWNRQRATLRLAGAVGVQGHGGAALDWADVDPGVPIQAVSGRADAVCGSQHQG